MWNLRRFDVLKSTSDRRWLDIFLSYHFDVLCKVDDTVLVRYSYKLSNHIRWMKIHATCMNLQSAYFLGAQGRTRLAPVPSSCQGIDVWLKLGQVVLSNFASASMQRRDVALALMGRCVSIMWPMWCWCLVAYSSCNVYLKYHSHLWNNDPFNPHAETHCWIMPVLKTQINSVDLTSWNWRLVDVGSTLSYLIILMLWALWIVDLV